MSTEEREVWIRVYCAVVEGMYAHSGSFSSPSPSAFDEAEKALDRFNARFNKEPAGYREPAR